MDVIANGRGCEAEELVYFSLFMVNIVNTIWINLYNVLLYVTLKSRSLNNTALHHYACIGTLLLHG